MISVEESVLEVLLKFIEAYKLGKPVLGKIKKQLEKIIDKQDNILTSDTKEFEALKRINENPNFCRLEELIGTHPHLRLVNIGIYIMQLNDNDKRELIKKIKNRVNKKHGRRGMKILHLGSTGVIYDVIEYLDRLKLTRGYDKEHIVSEFDKILDEWDKITIFVKSEEDKKVLRRNILLYITLKYPLFFVFAYGTACDVAKKTIADMDNDGLISQKNKYLLFGKWGEDKAGKAKNIWRFELCTGESPEDIF